MLRICLFSSLRIIVIRYNLFETPFYLNRINFKIMKKSSFLFLFFFYQLTFAQLSITGPSTIAQDWPYVTFSNYCTSGDTAAVNIWTLPSNGGYFNFAYGNGNPQFIAAQTKIKVDSANNCVSWGDDATWQPFYDVPATISVTNGGMSATKTILMTPST